MRHDMCGGDDTTLVFDPAQEPVPADERARRLTDPGFGRVFTDHMALIEYDEDRRWNGARITARKAFELHPATPVLHYAQEIFEGMKAYRRPAGTAALFRADANARRFLNSARRVSLPQLPQPNVLHSVRS